MKDIQASAEAALCPICGEGHVTNGVEIVDYTYKEKTALLPLRFTNCDTCGSESAGVVESRANKRAVLAFRKTVDGLLTGDEICAIRDKYKLKQGQAARLFGGGPVAFSKYENDDVAQSESMDTLLRLVRRSTEAFWVLVDEKKMASELTVEKSAAVFPSSAKVYQFRPMPDVSPHTEPAFHPYPAETRSWK